MAFGLTDVSEVFRTMVSKSQWLVPLPALASGNRKIVPPLLGVILNI